MGESTGGVTESLRRRIVLPAGASLAETDHVVGHELVHAFQYDIGTGNMQRMALLPLWFVEGMAEYLSLGPNDPHTAMWMRDAVLSERLPTIKELQDPKYFPYRYGQALWAYLGSRFGDDVVGNAMFSGMGGDAVARDRNGDRRRREDAVEGLARRAAQAVRDGGARRAVARRDRRAADHERGRRRRAEHRAGDQPGRIADRLSVGEESRLDRHVPGGRRDREDHAQAD